MGTPFFILATGQSNIINRPALSWSPNPRAKIWNNQPQNDTDVGTAYGAFSNSLMGIGPKYAHNIANADANKDVYYAEYTRGGMDIEHWIGGASYQLEYTTSGNGIIYLNNANPAAATAMNVPCVDLRNVLRRGTGSALNVSEFLWLKQGSAVFKYQINSWSENVGVDASVYVTCVASSGTLTYGSAVQVEFQPRFLQMIENSVPAALAAAGRSTVDIVLWWQGESDSYPQVNANYTTEFNFVMSYLGGKSWWGPNTKVVICGMNSTANNGFATSDQMNTVLANLVSGHPERYFCGTAASVPSSYWQDTWHMTATGYSAAGDILINNVYAPPLVSSGVPTYAVIPSASSVIEGSSVAFNVTTTGVGSTTLYWTNAGTTTGADFSDGLNSGSFSVTSDSGYFSRTLLSDSISDSGETIVIQIRTGSTGGTIVATASTVVVNDASGGSGSIINVVAGTSAVVMDVTTASQHQTIGGNTGYGLWIDGPPHPYKDASGNVYLSMKHSENYRFRVPDLNNGAGWVLQGPTFLSPRDPVEGHYNNRHWVYGLWVNGSTVHALTHHEWYVNMYTSAGVPGFNALNYDGVTDDYNKDWVNAIGHATSSDGGATFTINSTQSSSRCVLIPEPWGVQSARHMFGFFHASNIVKEGSYYYSAVEQRSVINAAAGNAVCGMSLLRTLDTSTPIGWQFWDGAAWVTVDHASYQGNLSSQVPHRFFEQTNNFYVSAANSNVAQNIRYHTPSGQWMVFGFVGGFSAQFGYSTSATLANPQFSVITPISSPDPSIFYPYMSVFDEAATDQNYQNIGNNLTVLSVDSSLVKIHKSALTITVSSGSATYAVSPNTTSVNEGSSVTFNVTTTSVGSTTLYWTNTGTTTGADFADGLNSGSFAVSGDVGSVTRTLVNDLTTEGAETIVLQIRTGSVSGPIVATSSTVTVNDTSVPAGVTYSVTPEFNTISEGGTLSFVVNTTGVGSTTLYWTNAGTTTGADFYGGANSGSFAVSADYGYFNRTLVNDLTTEGTETIVIQIRTGSVSGPIVATSSTVTVNDTSITPSTATSKLWVRNAANSAWLDASLVTGFRIRNASNTGWIDKTATLAGLGVRNLANDNWLYFASAPPTYSITPNITSINEGQSVTFNATTTHVGSATLYWTISGTTVGADFTDGLTSGSFAISGDAGSITRTLVNDALTEGTESFAVSLRTGSTSGPVVATSATVTVNDTSVTAITMGNLALTRNDLDFRYAPTQTSTDATSYMEIVLTVDCSNYFNHATNAEDHIVFCLDPTGTANTYYSGTRKHCGPITRYGADLFDQGRGFIIKRNGSLFLEQWVPGKPVSGPGSPIGAILTDYGWSFDPLTTPVFTVSIRAGYRLGTWGEKMDVNIYSGTSTAGPILAGFTAGWGWDYSGSHKFCLGAISMGFVPPASTGCVETTAAGPAVGATITASNFTFNIKQ